MITNRIPWYAPRLLYKIISEEYNVKLTVDFSHYQVCSLLSYGKENNITAGDLEKQIYAASLPSWKNRIKYNRWQITYSASFQRR
jgi:hypothetical protein